MICWSDADRDVEARYRARNPSGFDLEAVVAAGGQCLCEFGRGDDRKDAPARIICTDRLGAHPVVALVRSGATETTACFDVWGEGPLGRLADLDAERREYLRLRRRYEARDSG